MNLGRKILLLFCFFTILVLQGGCASRPVTVLPTTVDAKFRAQDRSAATGWRLSDRSLIFLRQKSVYDDWARKPLETLIMLDEALHREKPDRYSLSAMMELCFLLAKRQPSKTEKSARLYLSGLLYAYTYLFSPELKPEVNPYSPRFQRAVAIYNRSLSQFLLYVRKLRQDGELGRSFPLLRGRLEITGASTDFSWALHEFERFFLTAEFSLRGLLNIHTNSGMGAPMIAIRKPPPPENTGLDERFLSPVRQYYTASAFLRIKEGAGFLQGDAPVYHASVEIHDVLNNESIAIEGRRVPLEADYTTPLGYMISQAPPTDGLEGLFQVSSWHKFQGLHMLEPIQQDKIPVVFVHGLMSSPMTWMTLLNEILGDPVLRKRYQFWFFMYPTGNPIGYSAALLRSSLKQAYSLARLDGGAENFDQMVLVGHSMGGVLSRLMVQNSGPNLWRETLGVQVETLDTKDETQDLLLRVLDFEALPFVNRAVFMAAPHRGATLAKTSLASFAASFIELPFKLVASFFDIAKVMVQLRKRPAGKGAQPDFDRSDMPTGIKSLSPDDPFMLAVMKQPISPRVTYHSIIGNNRKADVAGGSDGVVPYESAHLDGAESEIIVKSGHGVQDKPETFLELRRILLEHLSRPLKKSKLQAVQKMSDARRKKNSRSTHISHMRDFGFFAATKQMAFFQQPVKGVESGR